MDLRDPCFPNPQYSAYFLHGEFFEVIQRENLPFARLKLTHSGRKQVPHFSLQAFFVWFLFQSPGGRSQTLAFLA